MLLLSLALGAAGCGEPTREEQVDQHLRAALDHMALHRWAPASAQVDRALRLQPVCAEALRFRELIAEASTWREPTAPLEREVFVGGLDRTDVDPISRAAFPLEVVTRLDPRLLRAQPGEPACLIDTRRALAGRKVTLHFDEAPLDEVASFLADITGLNVVAPPWLERVTVSVRLREVALVDALALIAGASGTYLRASEGGGLTFS